MKYNNVQFLHLTEEVAARLATSTDVSGTWVRVPELVAALHMEAEDNPVAAEALLAVANGLAVSAVRVANQ